MGGRAGFELGCHAPAPTSHGGGGGFSLWGFIKKAGNFMYHASGAADVVGCVSHPSWGGCAMAAVDIGSYLIPGAGEARIAEGMVEQAAKDGVEAIARDGARRGLVTGFKKAVGAGLTAVHLASPWATAATHAEEFPREVAAFEQAGYMDMRREEFMGEAVPEPRVTPSSLPVQPPPWAVRVTVTISVQVRLTVIRF
jgi:hypothetical protein